MELIVVIPVYNEEACIEEVIRTWGDFLSAYLGSTNIFKIIVVNDGSKDKTPAILDVLSNKLSYLQIIHKKNGGHGDAVLVGYAEAVAQNPEYVFQTDSDNQFLPEDFPKLWEKRNESNFIIGHRKVRYDDGNRLMITKILKFINILFFGVHILDANIPYRLIKGEYLKKIFAELPGRPFAPNIFLTVMAKKDGNELFSIPVTHKKRETGKVSIIKMKLLKVCIRSTKELLGFSLYLKSRKK